MITPGESDRDVFQAFSAARSVAEDHMLRAHRAGISWREETVSELLWVHAQPHVSCTDFGRKQENLVGTDWLWWWVDEGGECFGMLVQAKRLHHSKAKQPVPELDFGYGKGEQFKRLMATADQLRVPAMYALYFGAVESRYGLTCGGDEHGAECNECRRRSASLITGLQVGLLINGSKRDAAVQGFNFSTPLEDTVDPALAKRPVLDVNLRYLNDELRQFLLVGQSGARQVAKEIFRVVSDMRKSQFSAAVAKHVAVGSDVVFNDLPEDFGHFSRAYFPYVLRGLRPSLPEAVQRVIDGDEPTGELDGVAGIVVVQC